MPSTAERRDDRGGDEDDAQHDDDRARNAVERDLVLDQRRADRGRAEPQEDEDRREARAEEELGTSTRRAPTVSSCEGFTPATVEM